MKKFFAVAVILLFTACGSGAENGNEYVARQEGQEEITSVPWETKEFANLTWVVIDRIDDRVLLLSEDVVERRAFCGVCPQVTWGSSEIRHYLNNEFLYSAFTEEERAKIVEAYIMNDSANDIRHSTRDRIFLLSLDEVNALLAGDLIGARVAAYAGDGSSSWWWARSRGYLSVDFAVIVGEDGTVHTGGRNSSIEYGGIRPAIWVEQ